MDKTTLESVAKILIIKNGEALILKIGEHKAKPERSFTPDLPGGLVDPGESESEGVIREVFEETGLELHKEDIHLAYTNTNFFKSENKSITKLLYFTHLKNDQKITLSWEHCDYKWIPLNDLTNLEIRGFYGEAIKYILEKGVL